MKRLVIGMLMAAGAMFAAETATAQLKPSQDHFESRRRDAEYRENLRRQQAEARRRSVPTFTIPQPGLNHRFHPGFHDPRFHDRRFDDRRFRDRRFRDPRFFDSDYVFIPGHYQNVFGRLVYVPPHFQYLPR